MAHNFAKVEWVAMETLRQLKHRSEVFAAMTNKHADEFKKDFAVGETVRVKMPFRATVREGMTYTPQNVDRITTDVTVDTVIGSDIEWGSIDKLLNMERGQEAVKREYIDKLSAKLAAAADVRAARFAYKNTGNITGVLGTNPTTFDATSAAARQRFMELDSMQDDKAIFLPSAVMRSIKGGSDVNLARFGPVEEIKKLYKQGLIGKADGFDFYESNSLVDHTAGTWAGAVSLASAPANGASELSLTCTTGDTFKEGDVIGLASVYRTNPLTDEVTERANTMTVTVAADVTGAASAATVTIKEKLYFSGPNKNINTQPAASATCTLFPGTSSPSGKSGKQGLAFVKDAFAAVSLPLPMPKQEEEGRQFTDPDTGITLSIITSFDFDERKWKTRVDMLIGFGRLHAETGSMRILCA
jgi:hypothetical protein